MEKLYCKEHTSHIPRLVNFINSYTDKYFFIDNSYLYLRILPCKASDFLNLYSYFVFLKYHNGLSVDKFKYRLIKEKINVFDLRTSSINIILNKYVHHIVTNYELEKSLNLLDVQYEIDEYWASGDRESKITVKLIINNIDKYLEMLIRSKYCGFSDSSYSRMHWDDIRKEYDKITNEDLDNIKAYVRENYNVIDHIKDTLLHSFFIDDLYSIIENKQSLEELFKFKIQLI